MKRFPACFSNYSSSVVQYDPCLHLHNSNSPELHNRWMSLNRCNTKLAFPRSNLTVGGSRSSSSTYNWRIPISLHKWRKIHHRRQIFATSFHFLCASKNLRGLLFRVVRVDEILGSGPWPKDHTCKTRKSPAYPDIDSTNSIGRSIYGDMSLGAANDSPTYPQWAQHWADSALCISRTCDSPWIMWTWRVASFDNTLYLALCPSFSNGEMGTSHV